MPELDDAVYASITSLCAKGDELADEGEYQAALTHLL